MAVAPRRRSVAAYGKVRHPSAAAASFPAPPLVKQVGTHSPGSAAEPPRTHPDRPPHRRACRRCMVCEPSAVTLPMVSTPSSAPRQPTPRARPRRRRRRRRPSRRCRGGASAGAGDKDPCDPGAAAAALCAVSLRPAKTNLSLAAAAEAAAAAPLCSRCRAATRRRRTAGRRSGRACSAGPGVARPDLGLGPSPFAAGGRRPGRLPRRRAARAARALKRASWKIDKISSSSMPFIVNQTIKCKAPGHRLYC